jgi:hypothetical protein
MRQALKILLRAIRTHLQTNVREPQAGHKWKELLRLLHSPNAFAWPFQDLQRLLAIFRGLGVDDRVLKLHFQPSLFLGLRPPAHAIREIDRWKASRFHVC